MVIEESMQGFGATWELGEAAVLQCLSESVEETPDVAWFEVLIDRLPPMLQDIGNPAVGADTEVTRPDDEVVSIGVGEISQFVAAETGILMMPASHQFPDGTLYQKRQIADDVPSMLPCEFHFSGEGEVIADKDLCSGGDPCREGFIV